MTTSQFACPAQTREQHMDATTIRRKIAVLESLADPARASTPEHERAAACRMLDRFRALLAGQAGVGATTTTAALQPQR